MTHFAEEAGHYSPNALTSDRPAATRSSVETMTENGMELVEISPELHAAVLQRAAALQEEFVARVPEAGPIIEQFKAAR